MTFTRLRAALPDVMVIGKVPPEAGFSSVCIDSRTCTAGTLFVCLTGTARDGHQYAEAAFNAGAGAALVEKAKLAGKEMSGLRAAVEKYGVLLFAVDNTLRALQDAAKAYLEDFPNLLKIGVTGSSGKTTVKEIAGAIISCEKKVVMNKGNLNSGIGLPLSVFEARDEHEVGIFEMGMNRRGEIGELSRVLKPHIALITNIGEAHIGILGSQEAIAAEKKVVFTAFTGKETALIPSSDAFRDFLAHAVNGKVVLYDTACSTTDIGIGGAELELDGARIRFPLPGAHNVKNALAAVAIAKEVGVKPSSIKKGLESVKPLFGRSEIIRGRVTIVQDCYNANPESMAAAIEFCDSIGWQGRRIYVIGSMLELGAYSEAAHMRIGLLLAASRADSVFLFGAETRVITGILKKNEKPENKSFFFTENMAELSRMLVHDVREGDLVLLKGSRGCALERLATALAGGVATSLNLSHIQPK